MSIPRSLNDLETSLLVAIYKAYFENQSGLQHHEWASEYLHDPAEVQAAYDTLKSLCLAEDFPTPKVGIITVHGANSLERNAPDSDAMFIAAQIQTRQKMLISAHNIYKEHGADATIGIHTICSAAGCDPNSNPAMANIELLMNSGYLISSFSGAVQITRTGIAQATDWARRRREWNLN